MANKIRNWLPDWLDGRTVALLSAMIALGAMMQTAHMDLRTEIGAVRADLSAEISAVRADLSAEISAVRTDLEAEMRADR